MEWQERPRFSGFLIWVGELREGTWVASVAALPAYTAGPGGEVVPGEFQTAKAAEAGAHRYLVERTGRL
jgi:hypothetical protein